MSVSLVMSMTSLSVAGAGGGVSVARTGRAAQSKASVASGSAFFPTKTAAKMTMKSSLAGVVLPRAVAMRKPTAGGRGALVIVAGGNSLGCTLHGTRRARARTSGFRARLATPGGRRTLKLRRKKGRKYLAPAGAPNMWNKAKRKNLK